jgi:hypothetical protein
VPGAQPSIALIAAFTALLREAPELYLDVVQFFSKSEPTAGEESALKAKLKAMKNPDDLFVPPGVS